MAGVQNGTLYTQAQQHSLPAILYEALRPLVSGPFRQAAIGSENGYLSSQSDPSKGIYKGRLRLTLTGFEALPSDLSAFPAPRDINPSFQYTGPRNLNSYAVPDLKITQINDPTTANWDSYTGNWNAFNNKAHTLNPYYARFAHHPNATLLNDIKARQPTFFILWLGLEDLLGYAAEGARAGTQMTSTAAFTSAYTHILDELLASASENKGLVLNIPDLLVSIPYFTYFNEEVKIPSLPGSALLDDAKKATLNAHHSAHNKALKRLYDEGKLSADEYKKRQIDFTAHPARWLIEDESLVDWSKEGVLSIRHATANDRILLPVGDEALGVLLAQDVRTQVGLGLPLRDSLVLIPNEIASIEQHIADYNRVLQGLVARHNQRIGLVDVQTPLRQLVDKGPLLEDGLGISATFIPAVSPAGDPEPPTDLYSVDGIHPNSRGYAFIAKRILLALNKQFGVQVTAPLLGKYPTNGLP